MTFQWGAPDHLERVLRADGGAGAVRLAPRGGAGVSVVRAMPHVRPDSRRVLSLLLLLVVAAVVLQGASTPHTHAPSKPGVYNQDHDLVLQATLHGAAVLAEAPPAPLVFMLVAAVALLAISPLRSAPPDLRQSRPTPLLELSPDLIRRPAASCEVATLTVLREDSMRGFVIVALWLAVVLVPGFAAAQDAEALRRELDQLRRQQEQYQKAIEALSDRLKRLESQPAPAAVGAGAARPRQRRPDTRPRRGASGTPSLIDLARPREPFALYGQRGQRPAAVRHGRRRRLRRQPDPAQRRQGRTAAPSPGARTASSRARSS